MSHDDAFHRIGRDPFEVPVEARDRTRRLRGRLPLPVTVWTTYARDGGPAGITVSSVLISEGDSPSVLGLIAPLSDFWDAVNATKRFVVHLLDAHQSRAADQFALRYPGDPFDGLSVSPSPYGPHLDDATTRVHATLTGYFDAGYSSLVRGSLDEIELAADPRQPLVHYRGGYLTIAPPT